MQFDDMEKEFKSKLKGSVPEWDKMKNWDAIEAQLTKPKKKRRWLYFFLSSMSIIMFLLFVASILWVNDSESHEHLKAAEIFDVLVDSENRSENSDELNLSRKSTGNEKNRDLIARKKSSNGKYTQRDNENTTLTNSTEVDHSEKSLHPVAGITIKNESHSTKLLASDPSTGNTVHKNNKTSQVNTLRNKIKDISLLAIAPLHPLVSEYTLSLDEKIPFVTPIKENQPSLSLQVYGILSMPYRQFSSNAGEIQPYLDSRKNRETMAQSIETGVLLNANLTPELSLSSGIGLQRITERFYWKNVKTEIVPVLSDTAYYYLNQNKQRNYVADTVNAIVTNTRIVKNYNTHTFFNIPLLVSYEQNMGPFSLKATAGPVLQFYQGYEGKIFDQNENFITGDELQNQGVYKNEVGFSLQGDLEINRSIGKFGQLHAGVQYRQGFLSVANEGTTGYRQTYNSFGFILGWSYELSK
jgi:nitrogen fixation-related uncharacterized protein